MERIGSKLQKQGVMALLSLVLMNTGCEDKIDTPTINSSEGKTVEVSMTIGLAEEVDGYNLSASTKAASQEKGAFDVEVIPAATTRAAAVKPNALYKLEIRQYAQNGNYLNGNGPTDQTIGQRLTVNLTEATDCQLVFVAWGQNSDKSLGTVSLSKAQEVSIDATAINEIATDNMNTMPYVLHLKHVNVTGSGSNGIITSPYGEDVRILLKRLATRLNISWNYNVSDYTLKQITLQSIPRNYKVIAAPDEQANNTYPSLLDQYTNIQLDETYIEKGSYSCWIPANVRGFNTASNSPQYRIKANAPTGSVYASFIAASTSDPKKKFNYRVYLGGKDYSDFNLYENSDYNYIINFNHTGIPTSDYRVTYIDPIPASDNNENFLPTANCFMVAPGGAFCFNPYKYYVNGIAGENTLLQTWCENTKIQSVKVLWQILENGDLGDPVLGVVTSATDHTNIVDLKGSDFTNTRIYCRVAPNTTGGSGAIAAYDSNGKILWSWHIWVTDYNPDATGNEDVQNPENKRKQKYTNGGDQLPMMDRNLGAMAGYTEVPKTELERSKANGFHYQWGRKDPFRSSYSNKKISSIETTSIDKPIEGLLSIFKEDGVTFLPMETKGKRVDYSTAYQDPTNLYKQGSNEWISTYNDAYKDSWGGVSNKKGLHDPCPVGWKVALSSNYYPLFQKGFSGGPGTVRYANAVSTQVGLEADGGSFLKYDINDESKKAYFRYTGYWIAGNKFSHIGTLAFTWAGNLGSGTQGRIAPYFILTSKDASFSNMGGQEMEALLIRCIQERE